MSHLPEYLVKNMRDRKTDELVDIWINNDRGTWRAEAFQAISLVLTERGVPLPTQLPPSGVAPAEARLGVTDGWLLLPTVCFVLAPIISVVSLVISVALFSDVAAAGHGVLYAAEILVSLGLLALTIYTATLFFLRKREAPAAVIALLAASVCSSILLLFLELGAGAEVFAIETVKKLLRDVLGAAVWIPYFKVSKRVKATFVSPEIRIESPAWGSRTVVAFLFLAGGAFLTSVLLGPSDSLAAVSWFVAFLLFVVGDAVHNSRYFTCAARAAGLPLAEAAGVATHGFGGHAGVAVVASLVFALVSLSTVRISRLAENHPAWARRMGRRIKTSLAVGLGASTLWMLAVVLVERVYDPRSGAGALDLLQNASVIFLGVSILTFSAQAAWYFLNRPISSG